MKAYSRWDPFREMLALRSYVDRMLENSIDAGFTDGGEVTFRLPLDVIETEDEFLVKASLPGINPEDLEVTYAHDTLTIQAQLKDVQPAEGSRYHLRERQFGRFARSINLPVPIESDQIKADFEAGVLTLTLPKAEEVKPRRIPVTGGEKAVAGSFEKVAKATK